MNKEVDFYKVVEEIEAASLSLKIAAIELGYSDRFPTSIINLKQVIGDLECSSLIIKKAMNGKND